MPDRSKPSPLNRREFLRQTFAFSALAAASPRLAFGYQAAVSPQPAPAPDPNGRHMFLIGDWGTDKYADQQIATAAAMKQWVDQRHIHPGSLFLLGDNWYGDMGVGYISGRWQSQFEQMYPTSHFPGPCYAVLGNHDYERRVSSKVDLELGYAAHAKGTRWTMPSRWYTFTWPQKEPVITFICLDSNLPGTKKGYTAFEPWSFEMKHEERDQQDAWFRAELAKPRSTPFVAVTCHHPLYTNGIHRDQKILIRDWDALIRQYKVDFWISGHDHDLQHLEFAGHPTSFIISGGGGAELVNWTTPPEERGPFGNKALGFSDMEFSRDGILFRHVGVHGQVLHCFRKAPGGKVEIFLPTV
ncbi:MAG TPA: metallophosphoesterase [Acidobacteriaceae bacterium]|jgi:hypothetical protein|nr:metallophosphoesterase [Acidobacteriaceae bacterium]